MYKNWDEFKESTEPAGCPPTYTREVIQYLWWPKLIGFKVKWLCYGEWEEHYIQCIACRPGHVLREWTPIRWI